MPGKFLTSLESSDVHAVGNPLETRQKLSEVTTDEGTEMDKSLIIAGHWACLRTLLHAPDPILYVLWVS